MPVALQKEQGKLEKDWIFMSAEVYVILIKMIYFANKRNQP